MIVIWWKVSHKSLFLCFTAPHRLTRWYTRSRCYGWAVEPVRSALTGSLCWPSPCAAICWPSLRPGKHLPGTSAQSSLHWDARQTKVNRLLSLVYINGYFRLNEIAFLFQTSLRSHLVSHFVHSGWWFSSRWVESRFGCGGWRDWCCDTHLLVVFPPLPLQALQHHDGAESGWRVQLEHPTKPLRWAGGEELCSRARLRHTGVVTPSLFCSSFRGKLKHALWLLGLYKTTFYCLWLSVRL